MRITYGKGVLYSSISITLVIFILISHQIYRGFKPLNTEDNGLRQFVVNPGESASSIANRLEKEGFIYSRHVFKYLIKSRHVEGQIKQGAYAFSPSMPPLKILDDLINGRYLKHTLLIPEGSDLFDIAKRIEESNIDTSENFLSLARDPSFIKSIGLNFNSLEGFLYPDTYKIPYGAKSDFVIREMTKNFFTKLEGDSELKEALKGDDFYRILTLASIVEKETARREEKELIASVFKKRLSLNMPLQADPTVIYGLKVTNRWDGDIKRVHLLEENEYNTYKKTGLPPTPICNPSLETIKAAVKSGDTNYLYFVSKNDGSHHFSETISEHNEAVNRYQRNRTTGVNR